VSEKHIYISIPCYTGRVDIGTMSCLIDEIFVLNGAGVRVTLADERGNSMIAHSRNMIAAKFMASDATDLFFLDDDVTWERGAMLRLLNYSVDVVAGIYPQRAEPLHFHTRFMDKPELRGDADNPSLLEVEGVPAGFVRVSRNCIEQMVLSYPEKRFANKLAPKGFAWALFDNIHEGDLYFGEDYSFCRRWRQIGGRVFVDPAIDMGHIGPKHFAGNFGDWLKSR
jgi:hypothetical protein